MDPYKGGEHRAGLEWHQNMEWWAAQDSIISIVLLRADLSSPCGNVVHMMEL